MGSSVMKSNSNIVTDVDTANRWLQAAQGRGNLVSTVAGLSHLPPFKALAIQRVEVNPDQAVGDVYSIPGPGNKFGLSKHILGKLFAAKHGSILKSYRKDDGSDPYYVEWAVEVEVMEVTGVKRICKGTRRVDLRDGSPELSTMRGEKHIQQARRWAMENAETKALNRAIRSVLGLKTAYTGDEIQRPFIIPVLVPLVNEADLSPQMREIVAMQSLFGDAALKLYGGAEEPAVTDLKALPNIDTSTGEVIEETFEDIGLEDEPEPMPAPLPAPTPAPKVQQSSLPPSLDEIDADEIPF